jgi:hypothetical protein
MHAGKIAGYEDGGYYRLCVRNRLIKAHRLIWAIYHGEWPVGAIDHINGNGLDNRIDNLRDVTTAINARNRARKTNSRTGFLGVSEVGDKFLASGRAGGKTRHLGLFTTLDDALAARMAFEQENGFIIR